MWGLQVLLSVVLSGLSGFLPQSPVKFPTSNFSSFFLIFRIWSQTIGINCTTLTSLQKLHVQVYKFNLITDKFTSGVSGSKDFYVIILPFQRPRDIIWCVAPSSGHSLFHTLDQEEVTVQRSEAGIHDRHG